MDKDDFAIHFARTMRAKGIKFTREDAFRFIAGMTEAMTEGLAHDRKLIVSNFGVFEVCKFGSKIIQSPRGDNRKFFMPPTDVIKWHPSGKIRQRGSSEEIPDEEYQKLKGHPQFDIEPESPIQPVAPKPKRKDPYEVAVRVVTKSSSLALGDDSPLSRLIKAMIKEIKNQKAEKVEIRSGKEISEIVYISGGISQPGRKIPRISHNVIVEKIKSMAVASGQDPKLLILPLSETEKINITFRSSPSGEILLMEVVK